MRHRLFMPANAQISGGAAPSAASDGYAFVRSSRELAASSPHRPSLLPARTSDRIREHEARLRAVGLECGVGLGPGGVEAANDERKRIDRGSGRSSAGLVRAEPKVEVGHSEAMAGRAEFADDIAALDFLAALDVGLVHMAIERPAHRGVIDAVLDDQAITTRPRALREDVNDRPICRSNYGIALGAIEVDTRMTERSLARAHAAHAAVVRQDPRGALCRTPGKCDGVEQCDCEKNESPYGGT